MTEENVSNSGLQVVVDTSALLSVSLNEFIKQMQGAHVIIPVIVIQELEGLRNSTNVGFTAREWLRLIESLRGTLDAEDGGVEHNGVKLSIQVNHRSQESLPRALRGTSNDSEILAVAANTAKEHPAGEVILASNDLPMRLHARIQLKIPSRPLSPETPPEPWRGVVDLELSDEDFAALSSISSHTQITQEDQRALCELIASKTDATHVLAHLWVAGKIAVSIRVTPHDVDYARESRARVGVKPRSLEQRTAAHYLSLPAEELPIVSIEGKAGTGKTLIATAAGITATADGNYNKVLVLRGLHEMGRGQEMGFLPGDVEEKMKPWRGAIDDALEALKNESQIRSAESDAGVEVSPITYLRGRTLARTFVILEEAQNFSSSEILNVISRLGADSKLVLTFDEAQVDSRYLQSLSRADVWAVVARLAPEKLFAHITLQKTERSPAAELASKVLAEG